MKMPENSVARRLAFIFKTSIYSLLTGIAPFGGLKQA